MRVAMKTFTALLAALFVGNVMAQVPGRPASEAYVKGEIGKSASTLTNYVDVKVSEIVPGISEELDEKAIQALAVHVNDRDNPHEVTAEQIGALTEEQDLKAIGQLNVHKADD